MKSIVFFLILILLISFSGCWAPKSIITTANITQPVLVGKVKVIGGEPTENTYLQTGDKFSVALENSVMTYSAIFAYGSQTVRQGSNIIDKQLLPLIDETPKDSSAIIIADQIRFKVMSGFWLFVFYSANKGWIDGAEYHSKSFSLK